jgi:hypothetical protein
MFCPDTSSATRCAFKDEKAVLRPEKVLIVH